MDWPIADWLVFRARSRSSASAAGAKETKSATSTARQRTMRFASVQQGGIGYGRAEQQGELCERGVEIRHGRAPARIEYEPQALRQKIQSAAHGRAQVQPGQAIARGHHRCDHQQRRSEKKR